MGLLFSGNRCHPCVKEAFMLKFPYYEEVFMKEIIRQLIIDFNAMDIPRPTPRSYDMPTLPPNVRKAIIYIGMRRSGKTWVLYDFMHRLINGGLAKKHILYLDFTDDRLEGITAKDLQYIVDTYFEINPDLINKERVYFFFDEIQEIEGFERFIRRLLDKEKMHIYITGSSAKMLSKEISTLLRGRTIEQKVFPFSFTEYLLNKNIDLMPPYTSTDKYKLHKLINEYIHIGGFPEVSHMEEMQRIEMLQGYINSVVYRDIVDRYEIKNIHAVKATIHHCMKNAATKLSVNKLYDRFKSQGMSLSKDALYQYLEYFEDSFCVFSIPLFTPSVNKQQNNPKKIYPIDTGLITAYSFSSDMDMAAKLETLVFVTLYRRHTNIFYYLTNNRLEVDFVTLDIKGKPILLQVCVNINNIQTEEREIKALLQAMDELDVSSGYIVTIDTKRVIEIDSKVINVIPILELIDNDSSTVKI